MDGPFLLSPAAPSQNIRLGSAYFVSADQTVEALADAARRGVRVQTVVPGPVLDVKVVRPASPARWGALLEASVEISENQPTRYHTKMRVVDDHWVFVGSANMDGLSFKLNDEANLNVLDPAFATEQAKIFYDDLSHAKRYTLEDWRKRSVFKRISESMASMFSSIL